MKIGQHFSLWEATASPTAARLGISNEPDEEQLCNLKRTCSLLMDPIREKFGRIRVTSGLRVSALNDKIPGSSNSSYHRFGLAFDFRPYNRDVTLKQVMDWIIDCALPYDQLIYEYARWIHIAAAKTEDMPRRQALMKFPNQRYQEYKPDDDRVI